MAFMAFSQCPLFPVFTTLHSLSLTFSLPSTFQCVVVHDVCSVSCQY